MPTLMVAGMLSVAIRLGSDRIMRAADVLDRLRNASSSWLRPTKIPLQRELRLRRLLRESSRGGSWSGLCSRAGIEQKRPGGPASREIDGVNLRLEQNLARRHIEIFQHF